MVLNLDVHLNLLLIYNADSWASFQIKLEFLVLEPRNQRVYQTL